MVLVFYGSESMISLLCGEKVIPVLVKMLIGSYLLILLDSEYTFS